MGAADAVPGVSGGTIALITGIYERLITALTAISTTRLRQVLWGLRPSDRGHARRALVEMDAGFLVALGSGVFTAVVLVTGLVQYAVENYPVATFGVFLGLIAASALVLAGEVALDTPRQMAAALAGFLVAFLISGQTATGVGHGHLIVFLAGVVAVSAMILPGISGSLLLLLLGQYTFLTGTVSTLREGVVGLVTGGDPGALVGPAVVAGTFVTGAVLGLFTVAHVVRWALERHRQATLAFLISLVVGALRAPVIQIGLALEARGQSWAGPALGVVVVATLVGAVVVLAVDRLAGGVTL